MKVTACYLGTFDPLTNGHLNVIERAAKLFPNLIIGIGHNREKQTFLPLETRQNLIQEICAHITSAEVRVFEGLGVNFAKACKAKVLVRGLRTEADFVFEMQMATMNYTLEQGLETIFIPTNQRYSHISSSLVKEVGSLGGDISQMVPKSVFDIISKLHPRQN